MNFVTAANMNFAVLDIFCRCAVAQFFVILKEIEACNLHGMASTKRCLISSDDVMVAHKPELKVARAGCSSGACGPARVVVVFGPG